MEILIICLIALAFAGLGDSVAGMFVKHDRRTWLQQYEDRIRKEKQGK